MRIADVPIRVKLTAMLLVACVGVLVTACTAFVIFDRISYLQAKQDTLGVLTGTVGLTLAGPVAFGDAGSATTVLETLNSEPTALSAGVYDAEGKRLALWTREGAEAPSETLASLRGVDPGSDLVIERPIQSMDAEVGRIVVTYSTADVVARTWRFLMIAGFVLVASLLAASLAAGRLQRLISTPVSRLAEAAVRVRKDGDYAVRVHIDGRDELGALAETFNEMLAGIQARDASLLAHQQGLEDLVAERTADLDRRNHAMRLVLDNVNQGFVTIDEAGVLSSERSAAFDGWFGAPERDATLQQHLARTEPGFAEWLSLALESLSDGFMPREISLSQLPDRLAADGRTYSLAYEDVEGGSSVLVVVTDITDEIEAERAARHQQEIVATFEAIQRDRSGYEGFHAEADALVHRMEQEDALADPALLKRHVHTLKGNAALYGLGRLVELAHALEDRLDEGESVDRADLDELVEAWRHYSERVAVFRGKADEVVLSGSDFQELMRRIRDDGNEVLYRFAQQLRWEPVAVRLEALAERAAALAGKTGKLLEPVVEAGSLRLPPEPMAPFYQALVHAMRNSVDHGIEAPEDRKARGKPAVGRLRLSGRVGSLEELAVPEAIRLGRPANEAVWCRIVVEDDGRGVNWGRVAEKAREAGLPADTPEERLAALFSDGLSTAETVSELSGRGAGTAALAEIVHELGGVIEVRSVPGRGTVLACLIPTASLDRPALRRAA